MKKTLLLISGVLGLAVLTGCQQDKGAAEKGQTNRTVLTYLFQDTNLAEPLTSNINEIEQGWDDETDGTMLIYVDPSTKMTQFGGKPVLLEITHDTTNIIVSKVVKVYEDADATDPNVLRKVQEDVIAMYPADSYGLIFSGHGNGFMVNSDDKSKGISGSDRWSDRVLNVDDIAKNLLVHYEFIIFDACLMAETSTLYQLRNGVDFVVASVELSPGDGFAYRSDLKSLFTQPKADLYTFVAGTANYYQNDPVGQRGLDDNYMTIGVYRLSEMNRLAEVTKKVVTKLNLKYDDLRQKITNIISDPNNEMSSSMFYPNLKKYAQNPYYYDLGLLRILLIEAGDEDLSVELHNAINSVAIQDKIATSGTFYANNVNYFKWTAGMSFYIPHTFDPQMKFQTDAFYNRYEWSAATGFTNKWE